MLARPVAFPAMNSILLLAALAAGPDSLPPPTFAAPETVYFERVLNPAASPQSQAIGQPRRGGFGRFLVGSLVIAGGAYLTAHGVENPRYKYANVSGYWVPVEKSTNPEVYLGITTGLVGLLVMVAP